jgi:hypothetical protein
MNRQEAAQMASATVTVDQSERIAARRLWWAAPLTAVVAGLANSALFLVAHGAGVMTDAVKVDSPSGPQPMDVSQPFLFSVLGLLVGGLVLALIARLSSRPLRLWRIVGLVVLGLFVLPPLTIAGAPVPYILTLELMHLVAGAVALVWLPRLVREPGEA